MAWCEALRTIDHQSPDWYLALVSTLTSERSSGRTRRDDGRFSRREPSRGSAVPDAIRRLLPEPCLFNIAGLSCSGGSRDRCGNNRRANNWPDRLPVRVQEWVDKTYGRPGRYDRNRHTPKLSTLIQWFLLILWHRALVLRHRYGLPTHIHAQPKHPRDPTRSNPSAYQWIAYGDNKLPKRNPPHRPSTYLRPVISSAVADCMDKNAQDRSCLIGATRRAEMGSALQRVGLSLPKDTYPVSRKRSGATGFLLNQPLQNASSEFMRRTNPSLPSFVELIRGQTVDDYRPNKLMSSAVIETVCAGYPQLQRLKEIASEGVRAHVCESTGNQRVRPANRGSARQRLNVLRKNIRKEQDAWRCLVLDKDNIELWPEIFVSPFGMVDKADGDPSLVGRTIHDLSYPESRSINDLTQYRLLNTFTAMQSPRKSYRSRTTTLVQN
ncbi:LOW QUALITY PROTEIN: hypothetical protein PHMEG_00017011 [Phytophthora megakarya]|uniref:Uncharacterized protein n=1 Tax=Phytophthora megakarya TaxID=4795 RepID=A0A225VZZ0_9STRA|nr:LOW QUALITY PROTEIN: hypothetical protein PHMEG_00017011 [Phytophthora megakarya]